MDIKIKNGVIHVHSENSLKDSALKVDDLCKIAAELGAPAMTLTDHGTLTGIEEFLNAAKKHGIKPIPGVEAYFEENDSITHRAHLLLLAKDDIGYRAISKAVSESNKRLDSQNIPRMNMEILEKFFGKDAEGHGHVIATSACMAGVLAVILLENKYIDHEIAKVSKKFSGLRNPDSPQYKILKETAADLDSKIKAISEEVKQLQTLAKKPYTKKLKGLKAFEGTDEYESKKAALDAEMAESENAKLAIPEKKKEQSVIKGKLKTFKERIAVEEKDHVKWNNLQTQIDTFLSQKVSDEELYERALATASVFSELFGEGNFYIELQNHRIEEEIMIMPKMAEIAAKTGLPVVAANDVHIGKNTPNDVKARQIMRSLRFNKWEELHESDKELFMKTDEELSSILKEILPVEVVDSAMNNIGEIVAKCNYVPAGGSHYPVYPAEIPGETADEALRRKAYEGIEWRYPEKKGWTKTHEERLEYELGVIAKMGYSDYHCIVQDFLDYGRILGKLDLDDPRYLANPYDKEYLRTLTVDKVGAGVGPGRGSAVGSLVCYLTGITSVDPIAYNLIFERFLNVERVSMPDIDSDFRPDIREKVLDYVKYKYGEKAVCCIMTKGRQMARAAVRNCARLLGDERCGDTRTYLSLGDEIASAIPEELGIKLPDCVDDLREKFKENESALTIIENALLVEETFTNIGMHAAGVIIADNGDVSDYVPLVYIPGTGEFATQCDKNESEAIGLLKMDFLGLRNLGIINNCVRLIKERYGKNVDIERVPFEADVFRNIYAAGNTNSVFQFESNGMKQMLRQFKPEKIEDIILLVAAYRPGPMQYLDDIIAVKHKRKEPDYVIPEMAEVLGNTYGYPVYQEQIMTIFSRFAGFSLGEADIIRRYMSKKNTEKFMAYKDKFVDGMISRGGNIEKVEAFWNQLVEFSKYAFNSSHAAAYAFVSYYTAWLKQKYPKEYLCAVMNDTVFDKLGGLINDCKVFGIDVLPPDVNESEDGFSVKEDSIICGLGKIKNVGNGAAAIIEERKKGRFTSLADFMLRTRCKKDVVESLILAGAFDEFSTNRKSLIFAIEAYLDLLKKIKDKEKKLEETTDDAKKETLLKSIANYKANMNSIIINTFSHEDFFERLRKEKELVGAYISAHPLDSYEKPAKLKCVPISHLTDSRDVSIMGLISNLRLTHRKSDNKPMAFFKLEDQTGTVDCCCFTKAFAENGEFINADAVVKISGNCDEEVDSFTDETVLKMKVQKIEPVEPVKSTITLYVRSVVEWETEIRERIRPYLDKTGCILQLYDKLTGTFRETNNIYVNKEILNNTSFETSM